MKDTVPKELTEIKILKDWGVAILIILIAILLILLYFCHKESPPETTKSTTMSRAEAFDLCAHGVMPNGSRVSGCYTQGYGQACVEQCMYRLDREGQIR